MSITNEKLSEETITTEEIKLILDQYRIGKKPLAKLLGWGETTIIRYMEGDVPTNEYSNKLRIILEDPEYYYELLCKKKECLTGVAYKKSKNAAMTKIMATKIYVVAYYIVNRCNADVCAGCIQYLLYYAQAFSLALYDKELFHEEFCINTEQKPYLKLYEGMHQCGIHTLEGVEEYLTAEEKELINQVADGLCWYGSKALEAMITLEKSMIKISRDKYNNKIISKENLKAYFKDIVNKYQIENIKSIHNYPDQRFAEIKEFCK
jgi:hypothetical protein